jgi:DNA-binding NtrC family response regulator
VHQSLRRVVTSRRLPIELLLTTSASQAEQVLSSTACDVIVTDARLPDMVGKDLLVTSGTAGP